MFAESSGKLSKSRESEKLWNKSYLPNKVEDAILQWSVMNQQETEETRGMQRANQIISSFENNNKQPQSRMGETGPLSTLFNPNLDSFLNGSLIESAW